MKPLPLSSKHTDEGEVAMLTMMMMMMMMMMMLMMMMMMTQEWPTLVAQMLIGNEDIAVMMMTTIAMVGVSNHSIAIQISEDRLSIAEWL